MQDLSYFLTLGFSGADAIRGGIIALLASLLVSRRFLPWRAVIIACALDRLWPYYGMYMAEWDGATIGSAMWAEFYTIPFNIVYYVIRFAIILGIVHLGFHIRRSIHMLFGQAAPGLYATPKPAKSL